MAEDTRAGLQAALARADALYGPIRGFEEWRPATPKLDTWDQAAETLAVRRAEAQPSVVEAASVERLRAAAVDTGAIEGLYTTDRGFTLSVARQSISADQAEVEKGSDFRRNFEAQLEGFELALDVATSATPVSEALIRRLHEVTCAGQRTHRVITAAGVQERRLPLGTYKADPNHVQLGDGTFHAYAPVGRVPDEMHRLVQQTSSPTFEAAHPVVQAAYAHHCLTAIHPFADGNGRVARLLASVWLLRAASIPLWVEPTDRDRYLDALAAADRGDTLEIIGAINDVSLRLLRELGLAIAHSVVEPAPARREVLAADHALSRLEELLEDRGMEVVQRMMSATLRVGLPVGADARPALAVAIPGTLDVRVIGALVDESASADARIRIVSYPASASAPPAKEAETQAPDLDERFALDELEPTVTGPAARRLEAIVALVVNRWMIENRSS